MRLLALLLALALLVACATLTPPQGPGTEYPCGLRGLSCGSGLCCWEGDVCGSDAPFSRCPAGYCCADGTGARPHEATKDAHK